VDPAEWRLEAVFESKVNEIWLSSYFLPKLTF
jgi:hypothetical protein